MKRRSVSRAETETTLHELRVFHQDVELDDVSRKRLLDSRTSTCCTRVGGRDQRLRRSLWIALPSLLMSGEAEKDHEIEFQIFLRGR